MSSPTNNNESHPTQRTRYHAWIGLGGTVMIGLSLVLPWTKLIKRQPTGWDLISANEQLINELDEFGQARAARVEARKEVVANAKDRPISKRLKQRPGLGVRSRVETQVEEAQEQIEVSREQVDESLETVKSVLTYMRWAFGLLLVAGVLPVIGLAVANRRVSAVLALVTGVAGGALAAVLVVLACCLAGLALFTEAIPLRAGICSATAGAIILTIAGIWGFARP